MRDYNDEYTTLSQELLTKCQGYLTLIVKARQKFITLIRDYNTEKNKTYFEQFLFMPEYDHMARISKTGKVVTRLVKRYHQLCLELTETSKQI